MTEPEALPLRARNHPWPNEGLSASQTTLMDPAPGHGNVGRAAIYRAGIMSASHMPAVIMGQRGDIVDLTVFTYHGPVVHEGARFVEERPNSGGGENICWLVEGVANNSSRPSVV